MTTPAHTGVEDTGRMWGLLAEFEAADDLLAASRRFRDTGFTRWDTHAPYPVHGLDGAMGLRRSPIALYVLLLGLGGAAAGLGLQWWVSGVAAPLLVSGKPFFSWPAYVPIAFECGVLGGALGAFFGFLREARLPRWNHPLFESERFEQATDDRFFLSVRADDPRFEPTATEFLLRTLGATAVESVADPDGATSASGGSSHG